MIDIRTGKELKDFPVLEDSKIYIYIFLNNAGKVKIGKTKNILQRYHSLCGSNSAGDMIIKSCISPSTYLYTIETIMHDKFSQYRIPNTEWFYNTQDLSGTILFESMMKELKSIFSSVSYKKCNQLRKILCLKKEKNYDN